MKSESMIEALIATIAATCDLSRPQALQVLDLAEHATQEAERALSRVTASAPQELQSLVAIAATIIMLEKMQQCDAVIRRKIGLEP